MSLGYQFLPQQEASVFSAAWCMSEHHLEQLPFIFLKLEFSPWDAYSCLEGSLFPWQLYSLGQRKATTLDTSIHYLIFHTSSSSAGKGAPCKSSALEQDPWQDQDLSSVLNSNEQPWQKSDFSFHMMDNREMSKGDTERGNLTSTGTGEMSDVYVVCREKTTWRCGPSQPFLL